MAEVGKVLKRKMGCWLIDRLRAAENPFDTMVIGEQILALDLDIEEGEIQNLVVLWKKKWQDLPILIPLQDAPPDGLYNLVLADLRDQEVRIRLEKQRRRVIFRNAFSQLEELAGLVNRG